MSRTLALPLFTSALIPGATILVSTLIPSASVARIHCYKDGAGMAFGDRLANLIRSMASGWYALVAPGINFCVSRRALHLLHASGCPADRLCVCGFDNPASRNTQIGPTKNGS